MVVRVGEQITGRAVLTPAEIAEFARLSGDPNLLHHDEAAARRSRFGGIIVSGPQTIALMLGLLPAHFGRTGQAVLGLDFSFRFVRAIRAGETMAMTWRVTAVEPAARLGGERVTVTGEITNEHGQLRFTAQGTILVAAEL